MKQKNRMNGGLWVYALLVVACGPKYPNCENDDDCSEGEFCIDQKCQQCRESADCMDGQKCLNGACYPLEYCESEADCAPGQICRDSVCSNCSTNSECPDNQICEEGLCVPGECTSDKECEAGLSCVDGLCRVEEKKAAETSSAESKCDPKSIYFAFDSSLVSSKMRRVLEKDATCLSDAQPPIKLEGHCDPRGTTEYNMALGDRRARATKKLLLRMGMRASRVKPVSKGEEEADGYNEKTWAEDRRVDFEHQ